ncbi:MAG: YeeE/YedE family protein, partial [Sulfurovum sp.]|nr:YeeE/YedE family protein [Sulfurovaceae bacterium]
MQKYFTKQWSFLWAGIAFGIAQIIYMIGGFIPKWISGETPVVMPITVTTDLGKMFRGVEVWVCKTLGISDTGLYGASVTLADGSWMSVTGGAFTPGVGWPIVGMMFGGLLVAIVEKETRSWAKYDRQMLLIAFIGGAFFSYGTRLSGGCTLNHLLGGVPMMNIHSLVAVLFMSIGGFTGFVIMGIFDKAKYFKHQEVHAYAKESYEKGNMTEAVCYDPEYNPRKDLVRNFALGFSIIFFSVGIIGGLTNPEMLQHVIDAANPEVLGDFGKSIEHKGVWYVMLTLSAGIIGGFGMAKSGFGTECGLLTAEAHHFSTKNDTVMNKFKLPKITQTLFRGMLPLMGISFMWVMVSAFIIITWGFLDYKHGFSGEIIYALTAGVPIGGFLLGMGAVLLVGCEIRSYMRIGLGYTNTLVGFAGFALGYLPFTLFYDEHMNWYRATDVLGTQAADAAYKLGTSDVGGVYYFPQLFSDNHWVQVSIAIMWFILLAALFRWTIKKGARVLGTTPKTLALKNTEEVHAQTFVNEPFDKTADRLGLDDYKKLSFFDKWLNKTFGKK